MALAPLATVADLPDAWMDSPKAERALAVASSAVREAAGAAISAITGTITLTAVRGKLLSLPAIARNVTAVTVDGDAISDYRVVGNALWRACGWHCEPVEVAVTGTFGLPEIPDDIVDLTAQLAVAWLQHDTQGGGSSAGLRQAAIDGASESYTDEAAGNVSPVFIPEVTRAWLRSRFSGAGADVVDAS